MPDSPVAGVPEPQLWALILAAGESRRLGRPKQLLEWRGETLLQRAVRTAHAVAGNKVMVVLGHRAGLLSAGLECQWTVNPQWPDGMGSSLAAGTAALPEDASVLVMLCDQPDIEISDLRRLRDHYLAHPAQVTVSSYRQTLGVPAIFPPSWRPQLLDLSGDLGARDLLQGRRDLNRVPMSHAAFDVDTPADLNRLDRK